MFENFAENKKPEKPETASPSFEELVMALSEDERDELRGLERVFEVMVTHEREGGQLEIDHDFLTSGDEKLLGRYVTLSEKAQKLFEEKK